MYVFIHLQQVSGQEDLSDKAYCQRLFAPLWPSCLEITDNCQYTAVKEEMKSPSQKQGQCWEVVACFEPNVIFVIFI